MIIKGRYIFTLLLLTLFCTLGSKSMAQSAPADSCTITVVMHDDYGDGWSRNILRVYEGQTLLGTCTLYSGSRDTRDFRVANGSQIYFTIIPSNFQDECSFEVLNANGDTLLTTTRLGSYAQGDTVATIANTCPSCIRPTLLAVESVTATSATLSWQGSCTIWQIEYGPEGFTPGNGTSATTTDNNYTLYGLQPNQTYDVSVRATCANENSPASTIQLTTLHLCSPIDTFRVSQIGTTSALFDWSIFEDRSDSYASQYELTLTASNGTTQQYSFTDRSARITGLTPATAYTASLEPVCSNGRNIGKTIQFSTHGLPCLEPDTTTSTAAWVGLNNEYVNGVPVRSNYGNSFAQCVYRASDLTALGVVAGMIDSLYLQWSDNLNNNKELTILLGHTDAEQADGSQWIAADNSVVVYSGSHAANTDGTVGYKLNGTFSWDGSQSIVMTILMANPAGSTSEESGFLGRSTSTSYPATAYYAVDNGQLTLANAWTTHPNGSTYALPNVKIVTFGCATSLSCAAPTVNIEYIDEASVDISWIPGYEETAWSLAYKDVDATSWTVVEPDYYTTYYTFTGLNINTDYLFRVSSLCSDTSFHTIVSAHTQCGSLHNFPYTQDFESCISNLPTCYTTINSDDAETWVEYYGGRVAKMMSLGSATGFMLPPLSDDIDANSVQISFTGRIGSAYWEFGSSLIVGISDVAGDLTSFEAVDTLVNIPNTPYTYNVSFENYSGSGKYITFLSKPLGSNEANMVVVDNILLDLHPDCPTPVGFRVSTLHTNSAELAWDGDDSGNWILEYADHDFTPATNEGSTITTTLNSTTLSGLDSNTTYHAYLYADCGGIYSAFAPLTFTTLSAEAESLPISCTFESGNDGWNLVGSTSGNRWTVGNGTSHGGNNALYISNNGQDYAYTTGNQSVAYAVKDITIPDTGTYYYAYDWNCNAEGNYDYMRLYLAPAGVELVSDSRFNGITATTTPNGWLALDNGRMSYSDGWDYTADSVRISHAGQYRLLAVWVNDEADGHQPPAALDNFSFSSTNCAAPSSFAGSTNTDGDIVTLSWVETVDNSVYQIHYAQILDGQEQPGDDIYGVSGDTLYFTDLPLGVYYNFYIRSECGSDSSNWQGPVTLLTGPKHVIAATGTDTLYACTTTIFDNGGAYGNYASDCNSKLYVMPATPNSTLSISGRSYTERNYDYLKIYDGDENGIEVFNDQALGSITSFGPIEAENGFFTIVFHSDGGFEYAGFELTTHCLDNSCPAPVDLAASNATTTSVDLSWTDRTSADSWIIEYGTPGFVLGQGTQVVATSNPYRLTVPEGYEGEYYVRTICNPGSDTGRYSVRPCRFRTSQQPASLPYLYTFDNAAEWALWQTASSSCMTWQKGTAQMELSYDSLNAHGANNAFAYRDIDFGTTDTSAHLSFRARRSTWNSVQAEGLYVLMVDPATPVVASSSQYTTPWGGLIQLSPIAEVDTSVDWTRYSIDLDHVSGIRRLVFYWFNDTDNGAAATPAAVDSISIRLASCAQPYGLAADDVTAQSAVITWQGTAENGFTIRYTSAGQAYPSYEVSQTNSVTLTGLLAGTTYTVDVMARCGSESSDYSAPLTFTTESSPCNAPTALTATNVTDHSAVLSWDADEWAHTFEILYGASGTSNGGQTVTVSATTHTLTGLQDGTVYDAYVRTVCDDDTRSEWSALCSFTTLQTNGIADLGTAHGLVIYPNPASGSAKLRLDDCQGDATISIYDVNGRLVATQHHLLNQTEVLLDLSSLAQGTYFVRVVAADTIRTAKLSIR